MILTEVEVRVLGALIEKEITTPEYYPLSLNALVNACNQKNNREPVTSLGEDEVAAAVQGLRDKQLAEPISYSGSRVVKYSHTLGEAFNLDRRETAILCVLLLRGPQTVGELRGRSERMHKFEDLNEVHLTLQRLSKREPAMAALLVRQPGTKEARYAHLLGGPVDAAGPGAIAAAHAEATVAAGPSDRERIAELEARMAEIANEIADLRAQFAEFRKQFD
ncbi:MAG: YceH family protein [Candidatus Acidiferrales bacterium]